MSALLPDETVLGLLAEHPQHGYDLLERFRHPDGLGRVWDLSTSQLYNVLKRLEAAGQITGRQVETLNGPPRTEYTLTPSGRAAMEAWLNDPNPTASIRGVRVEFLSRLYVARVLGCAVERIIQAQYDACARRRDELLAEVSAEDSFGQLPLLLHIAQIDAAMHWIQTEVRG